jgi:hypothetical protein
MSSEVSAAHAEAAGQKSRTAGEDLGTQMHADLLRRISEMEGPEYRQSSAYVTDRTLLHQTIFWLSLCFALFVLTAVIYLWA